MAAAAVLSTLSVGCVSQQTYDELDAAYRRSQEQLVECQARVAELEQQMKLMDPADERAQLAELKAERDRLQAQIADWEARYNKLASEAGQGNVIVVDAATDKALREWAEQNADIAEYDAARGMVKLRSDLTFALGSDAVTPAAKATLARLAGVLNGAASAYEVRIIGHTDAVPISRAATKAAHPTNWHLGAHRAISVKDALDKAGVDVKRMQVSSYGPYRPVAQNTSKGAEANRRVEIYLVGMTPVNESFLNGAGAAAPAPAPATGGGDPALLK
jgi:chemotaxis protein MotB